MNAASLLTRLRIQRAAARAWLDTQAYGAWGSGLLGAIDAALLDEGFVFFERPHRGAVLDLDDTQQTYLPMRTRWRHPEGGRHFDAVVTMSACWGTDEFGALHLRTALRDLEAGPGIPLIGGVIGADLLVGPLWSGTTLPADYLAAWADLGLADLEENEEPPVWRAHVDAQVHTFLEQQAAGMARELVTQLTERLAV